MVDEVADYTAENQYQLRRLLGSIEASYGGLNLLICICDNPYYRDEIIKDYETELDRKGVKCQRVTIDRHYPSLKQSLIDLNLNSNKEQPVIVTVFGIDGLLNIGSERDRSPSETNNRSEQEKFFFSVQWTRESLREFRFPVILWMTESIAGELSRQAPDFWSWRGGVFEFVRSMESIDANKINVMPIDNNRFDTNKLYSTRLSANPEAIQAQIDRISAMNPDSSLLINLYLSLGKAYNDRAIENPTNKAIDLENAISAYKQGLKIFPNDVFLEDWIGTKNNIGIAYGERIRGESSENIELAIESFHSALTACNREIFPELWAMTNSNLTIAYSMRIQGKKAENLELAIEYARSALEIYTREAVPEQWALIHNNLASVYIDRIRGDRADNLERAIESYQLALEIYTHEAVPEQWALIHNNLASVYIDRIRGDRADNLERAIESYQLALSVYTPDTDLKKWTTIQRNLVNAQQNMMRSIG